MHRQAEPLKYRPDIDGLRAIAVLSVILFHIDYRLVPGGFVGVDIFYVISGYLITRIIGEEMLAGRFSFGQFYVRRMRRILPAFLVVVVATLAVGWIVLLPEDLASLVSSVKYALIFSANILFSRERGYFDLGSDETPLLHLWSLSVEEQFYFVWPVLLFGLCIILRKLPDRRSIRALLPLGIAVLTAAAFAYSAKLVHSPDGPTRYYFLLQNRAGEILIGALAAFIPPIRQKWLAVILGSIGFCALPVALFAIHRDTPFPGFAALLPCGAAALLIYSGKTMTTPVSRCLGALPLVWIGLLSYALYLWHWPVLAYMRYVYGRYALPWHWTVTAVLLTFALAFATYLFVERPFKRRPMTFWWAFPRIYLVPSALLAAIGAVALQFSAPQPKDAMLTSYGLDVCHGNLTKRCVRGAPDVAPSALVIGDSHAAALNTFVDVVGKREGWAANVVTGSSCSPVFGFDEKVLPDFAWAPCAALKTYVRDNYLNYKVVVITSYWAFQMGWTDLASDKDYLRKLEATLRTIAAQRPVVVLSDVPHVPVSPFRLAHFQQIGLHVSRETGGETTRANETIRRLTESIPNVRWVDLTQYFADFDQGSVYQGKPIYFDNQHLNIYGSGVLAKAFTAHGLLLGSVGQAVKVHGAR
ncbi:O-acetyltransferase OatA [Pandoraea terrae]|uniref:O-acetyltransferase OatA n=1 Tax=Pandoraea terrae TaxID=1537710 RepID=A0A5E4Y7X3_9BURK|nr:acyltransferase family protein [Pandoraea terrae]VVE44809.1 O-acetyltransferase OatA [Pandoraea terrae]